MSNGRLPTTFSLNMMGRDRNGKNIKFNSLRGREGEGEREREARSSIQGRRTNLTLQEKRKL